VTTKVQIADWVIEEDHLVVRVGDELSSWLTFEEAEGPTGPEDPIQVVRGTAHRLPSWPGETFARHAVRIDLEGGGALYWDAPEPVEGPVEVTGTVSTNNIDAPDGFPETRGVVRRVRPSQAGLLLDLEITGADEP
jgi:hypothetical protein